MLHQYSVVCLMNGPQPLPSRFLHSTENDLVLPLSFYTIVSFSQCHLVTVYVFFLYPLHFILHSIFPTITCFIRQFVRNPVCPPSFYFVWDIPFLLHSLVYVTKNYCLLPSREYLVKSTNYGANYCDFKINNNILQFCNELTAHQ